MTRLTPEDEERGRLLIQHLFAEIDALRVEIAERRDAHHASIAENGTLKLKLTEEREANMALRAENTALETACDGKIEQLRAEIATFRNASPSLCNCSECIDLRVEHGGTNAIEVR